MVVFPSSTWCPAPPEHQEFSFQVCLHPSFGTASLFILYYYFLEYLEGNMIEATVNHADAPASSDTAPAATFEGMDASSLHAQCYEKFANYIRLYGTVLLKESTKPDDVGMKFKILKSKSCDREEYCFFIDCEKRKFKKLKKLVRELELAQKLEPLTLRINGSLQELAEYTEIQIQGPSYSTTTLCGAKLQFDREGQLNQATLGGLIMVETAGGQSTLYGLTAGHGFRSDLEDCTEVSSSSNDSDSDYSSTAEPDTEEVDLIDYSVANPTQYHSIGNGQFYRSYKDTSTSYDWALIKIETAHWLPNVVYPNQQWSSTNRGSSLQGNDIWSRTERIASSDQRDAMLHVVAITSHGIQPGKLLYGMSYLCVAPSKELVATLLFVPHNHRGISSYHFLVSELFLALTFKRYPNRRLRVLDCE